MIQVKLSLWQKKLQALKADVDEFCEITFNNGKQYLASSKCRN